MPKNRIFKDELKAAVVAQGDLFDMTYLAADTECGTTMCIAGLALHLAGYELLPAEDGDDKRRWFFIGGDSDLSEGIRTARDLLDLSSNKLFYADRWPTELQNELRNAVTETRIQAALKAIDWFMR
jgi:hypothetical protein